MKLLETCCCVRRIQLALLGKSVIFWHDAFHMVTRHWCGKEGISFMKKVEQKLFVWQNVLTRSCPRPLFNSSCTAVAQSVNKVAGHLVGRPANQSIRWQSFRPYNRPYVLSVGQSFSQSVSPIVRQSFQSLSQPGSQSLPSKQVSPSVNSTHTNGL